MSGEGRDRLRAAGAAGDVDGRGVAAESRACARLSAAKSARLRCSVSDGSRANVGETADRPLALRVAAADEASHGADAIGTRGGDPNRTRGGDGRKN